MGQGIGDIDCGLFAGELLCSRGAELLSLSRRDTNRAGGFDQRIKFVGIHLGDVLFHDFVERDVRVKVLEVRFSFHGEGSVG